MVAELTYAKQFVLEGGHDLAAAGRKVGQVEISGGRGDVHAAGASLTWEVGACGLMSHTGAVGVTYMSLAPVLAMAVSEMHMLGGVGPL